LQAGVKSPPRGLRWSINGRSAWGYYPESLLWKGAKEMIVTK